MPRRPRPRRLLPFGLTALALALGSASPAPSAAAPATPAGNEFTADTPPQTPGLPDLDALDPVRYAYDGAIVEHYQVPTRFNPPTCQPAVSMATCPHSIWIDVIRPDTDAKVPAIMMASPYYNTLGRGYQAQCKTPHFGEPRPTSPGLPTCASITGFPEWYDEYFVPRGYAFVAMDLYGTRNSSGCQTYGDRDEVLTAVDVVDFIAEQPWSNGKVGMTGGSYDGTVATGAAAEAPISGKHPDALAAIIPIRAIDAWYDYHWYNGVQFSSHAITPAAFTAQYAAQDTPNAGPDDPLLVLHAAERKACIPTLGAATDAGYTQPYHDADATFWAERDFAKDAATWRAATFVMHGLYDFNVKPHNAGYLWHAIPDTVPKKLWLLNGDHFDPRCPTEEDCGASGHQIEFPLADKFIEANHRWWLQYLKGVEAGALAPPVEVQRRDGSFQPSAEWPVPGGELVLTLTSDNRAVTGPVADEASALTYRDAAGGSTTLEFETAPFTRPTRVSGQFAFELRATLGGPDTAFAVTVEDVPPDDDNETITYGWLRAWYRDSVSSAPDRPVPHDGSPVTPGTETAYSFASMHTDYVLQPGHKLLFRIGNAAGGSLASYTGQDVAIATGDGGSTIRVPVAAAGGDGTVTPPTPSPAPRPPSPAPQPRPRQPRTLPSTGGDLPPVTLPLAALALAGLVVARRRRA